MRMMIAGAFICLLALPGAGYATEDDDVTITGWRVVAGDKSEITSDCIGSFATPLCVVDTMMACAAWSDPSPPYDYGPYWPPVCDPLRLDASNDEYAPRTFRYGSGLLPEYHRDEYKVIFFPVSNETMDNYMRAELSYLGPELAGRPGDLAATIRLRTCEPLEEYALPLIKGKHTRFREGYTLSSCREIFHGSNNTAVILRKNPEGGWRIITVEKPHRDNTWAYVRKMYQRLMR